MKNHVKSPFELGAAAALLVVALVGSAGLSACSTPAPTAFHSLLPPPSAVDTSPSATSESAPMPYDFGTVTIPPQVDQPQFVIRNPDDSLTVLEQQRWISPLASEIHGALAERLGRRFRLQQVRQTLPGAPAAERLNVDVLRFESIPGQEVRIEAAWTVRTLGNKPVGLSCHSEIRQSVGTGYEAIAAGHRAALALLADEMGPALRALPNGDARCHP